MKIKCDWCGKNFDRKKCLIKENNYCSRICLGMANAERYRVARLYKCDSCGVEFERPPNHKARNSNFFCSKECSYNFKKKKILVKCDWCGDQFWKKQSDIKRTKHNFCSHRCSIDFVRWTGETRNVTVEGIAIHRRIVEESLGRSLTPEEEVHHIDHNYHNNKLENLMVVNKSEHSRIHAKGKERDSNGRFIKATTNA